MAQAKTFSERLMELIIALGLNKNSFAMRLGLNDNATIVRIVNDPARGPSFQLLQSIISTFPVNPNWLILGDGEMFLNDEQKKRQLNIRYFSVAQMKLDPENENGKTEKAPIDWMKVYGYEECDYACDVLGDSMSPRFQHGDIVICRKCEVNNRIPIGEAYVISLINEVVLRYIKGFSTEESFKVGAESSRYDDYSIRKDDISSLYQVKGLIRRVAL